MNTGWEEETRSWLHMEGITLHAVTGLYRIPVPKLKPT